jgi:hypothetical protein
MTALIIDRISVLDLLRCHFIGVRATPPLLTLLGHPLADAIIIRESNPANANRFLEELLALTRTGMLEYCGEAAEGLHWFNIMLVPGVPKFSIQYTIEVPPPIGQGCRP